MSVSEVRKAGSSDMRRPKQYRLNVEHITRYRRTPEASRLKEKTAEKNLCGLIIFIRAEGLIPRRSASGLLINY